MRPDEPGRGDDQQPDTRPYLCIPYWTDPITDGGSWDDGSRRGLPAQVLSWACPSIHAGDYTPGRPLEVTVEVRNSGGGNAAAAATVVVYWADPTVGFAKPTFFAAATVAAPPDRTTPATATTATMTATIPATAPAHVCLLAVVSHPQDRAGKAADPINDRHWAQRNLMAVAAAPGAPALPRFAVANPRTEPATFQLRAGAVDERRARAAAQATGLELADTGFRVRILDADGAGVAGPGTVAATAVDLEGLERRDFQLLAEVDGDLAAGTAVVLEVLLVTGNGEGDVVGSLAVQLVAEER
ncbi:MULTISPECIES: hypothetical protein [unclassified Pseudonocardia]|jgi:hypothetical protein|uniref:hypothetical protein n=1 Tax=unclassified Pseudonocardia TaxID=2619320 RepID=UPI000961396F|nr:MULTISPECIES: hypothetical protein [unclassified Pseudonocardia]MBN9099971.1 hypothetical protein [Pseudonocardia sp.]OJY48154.1 MAG: hypothetical protein BGP03_10900 [Pseudonocardia sp. 73-21]